MFDGQRRHRAEHPAETAGWDREDQEKEEDTRESKEVSEPAGDAPTGDEEDAADDGWAGGRGGRENKRRGRRGRRRTARSSRMTTRLLLNGPRAAPSAGEKADGCVRVCRHTVGAIGRGGVRGGVGRGGGLEVQGLRTLRSSLAEDAGFVEDKLAKG